MSRVGQLIGEMMGHPHKHEQPWRPLAAAKRRKFLFEPLDPRLLLSATPFYSAAGAQAAVQLTVQLADINGVKTLQVVDSAEGVVASTTALDARGGLAIIGSGFDDTLTLASDLSRLNGRVSFDGGGGNDTLAGPLQDTTWNVNAADAGSVRGLGFSHVGTLQGAAGNQDSFVFSATGSLSGRADGGDAGFDSITLAGGSFATTTFASFDASSGTISRDANLLRYTGMEPITDLTVTANRIFNGVAGQANNITLSYNAGTSLMVFASNLSETVNFVAPTASLTLNGQGTTDTISLTGVAPAFNAVLQINGNSTVASTVAFNGAVSTGNRIAVGSATDINVNANLTATGNIQLSASRSITVANNVAVTAGAFNAIQFNVAKSQDLVWNRNVAGFKDSTVATRIDIGSGASLTAGDVDLTATAGSVKYANFVTDTLALTTALKTTTATLKGTPALTFADNGALADTVTRGAGNWRTDGFQPGQLINIAGAGVNNGDYQIQSLSADGRVLTIEPVSEGNKGNFSNATIAAGTAGVVVKADEVLPEDVPLLSLRRDVAMSLDVGGSLPLVTFKDVGASDTIQRSSGNWSSDGFVAGQRIYVKGSLANDGVYRIGSISGDGRTLTLNAGRLLNEGPLAGAGGLVTVQGINEAVGSILARDLQNSANLGNLDLLATIDPALGSIDVGLVLGFVNSASSAITVNGSITATNSATINATANSTATLGSPGGPAMPKAKYLDTTLRYSQIGATYLDAEASATTRLGNGAVLTIGNTLTMRSIANNTATDMTTLVAGTRTPQTAGTTTAVGAQVAGAAIAVTYEKARTTATATVGAGASVQAGYAFDLNARTTANLNAQTGSQTIAPQKNMGQGVGLTWIDAASNATARIDGSASVISGGAGTGVNVIASAQNLHNDASTQVSTTGKPNAGKADNKLTQRQTGAQNQYTPGVLGISAGIVLVDSRVDAVAAIGNGAAVRSDTFVNLDASVIDNFKATAVGGSNAGAEISIGGAVVIADYNDHADASIGDNATVDAGISLVLRSNATIPDQVTAGQNFVNAAAATQADLAKTLADLQATPSLGLDPQSPTSSARQSQANAQTYFDRLKVDATLLKDDLTAFVNAAVPYYNQTSILPDQVATTYTLATAAPKDGQNAGTPLANYALSGTVQLLGIVNNASSHIGKGARINQDASLRQAGQSVTLASNGSIEVVDISGISTLRSLFQGQNIGTKLSLAGSYIGLTERLGASSFIDDGAQVFALGSVTLTANTKNLAVDLAHSGGQSKSVAISGAVVYNDLANTALAYVENEASVNAGVDLVLSAKNELTVAAIAGTVNQAAEVGIGLSGAINNVADTALAFIGNANGSAGAKGTDAVGRDLKVSADNIEQLIAIAVAGTKSDPPQGGGGDSQIAPGIGQNGQSGSSSLTNARKAGGVGISGAAALNFSNQTTKAYVDTIAALQVGRDLAIRASGDSPVTLALAGPIAIDTGGGSGSVGIAGGFTENNLDRATWAYDGADTTVARNASVTATTSDTVVPIAIGAAGQKSTGTAALAGSVTLELIDSDTRAWVNPATGTTRSAVVGGNLNVAASADLLLVSVAGGFGVGGKFGLGAGVDVSIIKPTVTAFVGNSVATPAGNITVVARDDSHVVSIAASLGLATNQSGVGIAGSASSQNLTPNVQAYVAPNATIATDGSLLVSAHDAIDAVVVSGGAGGGGKAGLGASVANVNIGDTATASKRQVQAYIGAGASVEAKGHGAAIGDAAGLVSGNGALVAAGAAENLVLISAGGALGNTFAFAASATVETMLSDVRAWVGPGAKINLDASNADAAQSLVVRADQKTGVIAFAGALAAAVAEAAIGAAADVEVLDRTVRAYIDSSAATPTQVGAANNVIVDATTRQPITSIAIGLSGAGNIALAGSASVIKTTTDTEAWIGDAANVVAASNVVVTASRQANILGIGGAGAIGLNSLGIAATTSTVIETDVTKAFVGVGAFVFAQAAGGTVAVRNGQQNPDGSGQRVNLAGVAISATGFETIQGFAVGGAVGSDAAISGAVPVVVLDTETKAYIDRGAKINQGALPANAAQSVNVLAGDATTLMQIGGAVAFGGAAIGAAVDVAILTKDTEAFIADAPTAAAAAAVNAAGDVLVQAVSNEAIFAGSGSLAAGGVSLGGAVGVFLVGTADTPQITRADIGRNAVVFANRNVGVIATDKTTLFDLSGSGAYGGTVGIGASASVPVVNKQTYAVIDNDAKVDALGNGNVIVGRDGSFGVQYVDFGPGDGYGGNVPTITKVQPPKVTGAALDCSRALTGQRIATPNNQFIHGIVVSATNQDDIEIFAVSGALSGGVAVSLAGSVNVHTVDTQASIGDRAQINQNAALQANAGPLQSVLVAAGNDYFHLGVGGAVGGASTAGVAPAVDVTILKETAIAHIGRSAQVKAVEDVTVVARNQEEILSIAVGLGVGGLAGVAGTVALIDVDNHTLAFIDTTAPGSSAPTTVAVGGNLDVRATDDTGSHIIAGAAALGGNAGIGVAVGVNDIHKDTRAFIADAVNVSAGAAADLALATYDKLDPATGLQFGQLRGVAVQAASSEAMCTIVAAGAAGGYVGLAGGVGVSIVDSDTQAFVGKRAVVSTPGSISVAAYNKLQMDTDVGAIGLAGLVGLAGGVDVGVVRSDTQSFIDDGAAVTSGETINVNAYAEKNIDSLAFSGAGGLIVGVAGAVSVYSIGSALDADANTSLTGGGGKTLDNAVSSQANTGAINDRLASFSGRAITTEQKSGLDGVRSQTTTRNFAADFRQPIASGTSAHIGAKTTVTAADKVNVRAKDNLAFNAVTGNGAIGGAAGIGGSVTVVNIGLADTAYLAPTAVLSVGPDLNDDITIEATLHDGKLNAEAYGGQGGALALGGQVTVLNDKSTQLAYIDQGVVVKRADHLNVVATAERPATLHSGGVQVGGLALGASVSRADLNGSTIAFIGHDPAAVRPATVRTVVNWLNVTADNNSTASVDDFAATVGILAGAGTDAKASVTPIVKAYIDGNNIARVNFTASITAHATDDADARAYGVTVGGVAAGVSLATAIASPDMQAWIGSGAGIVTGRDLIVQSVENYAIAPDVNGTLPAITGGNPATLQRKGTVDGGRHPDNTLGVLRNNGAYATSFSASGSLVGGDGATSTADDSAALYSHIDGGAVVTAGGNVSVLSLALNDSHALASGVTFGLIAGGGSKTATANANGSTRAALDGRVVKGVNLDVQALATDTGHAVTDATAASVGGAGLNSTSTTNIAPTLTARIGHESFDAGSAVSGSAIDLGFVHGYATGQRLVYDNGTPASGATFSLPVTGGGTLTSGATYYAIVNAATPTRVQLAATLADAQNGKAIQFGAVAAGTRQSLLPPGPNPYATVSGNVHLLSKSLADGDAAASGLAGSVGISAGLTYATSTVTPNLKTFIGQGGSVAAGGDVTVESQQGAAIVLAGNTRFDPTSAVNAAGNTITIASHGFADGSSVTYSRSGGGDIGLADQRSYHVIRVDADTVKLGDGFVAANVSAANSTIDFAGGHAFKSGDEVVYDNGGGANTAGLLNSGHYFVKVLDPNTVQLFATRAAALAAPVTFSATNVAASNSATPNRITLPDAQTLADGTIVTYRLLPADFSDGLVGIGGFNGDGTPIAKPNVVYFGTDYLASHPLASGSRIKYQTSNQPLNGLVNGATYFVINNGDGTIGLSLTNGGPALAFSAAPADHSLGNIAFTSTAVGADATGGFVKVPNLAALNLVNGQALVYKALDGVAIGGLQNNATYYVVLDATLTNAFRLATSPSLAQSGLAMFLNGAVTSAHSFTGSGPIGGLTSGTQYRVIGNADGTISLSLLTGAPAAIALNPANVFGLQALTPSPIALAGAGGGATQTLAIALKPTADATAQALLPDSSGAQLGGGADGIVTAVANAAAYSVIGAGTGSETTITLSPSVATFLDLASNVSGGNVKVLSTSNAQTGNSDTNTTGSFIAATNPYAHTLINHVNQATLGSGVTVNARGDFTLDATAAQGGSLSVSASAGAGIAIAYADHGGQALTINYTDQARLGQNARVTAGGSATVSTRAVTVASASATSSGKGFGAGSRAAVSLVVNGNELTEVGALARLTAANVVLDSKVDATLSVNTDAYGGGFATEGYATSSLNAVLSPTVAVRDGAVIAGSASVKVNASNNNVSAQNKAHTTTAGVFAYSIAETNGTLTSRPTLTAPAGAHVVTPLLQVTSAPTGAVSVDGINNASRDVYAIDAGHVNQNAAAVTTPIVNFNPTLNLTLGPLAAHDGSRLQLDRLMASAADAARPMAPAAALTERVMVFDPELGIFVNRKPLAAVQDTEDFVRYAY